MYRRTMLKSLLAGVPLTAGAAVAASTAFIRDKGQQTRTSLEQRLDQLKSRVDDMDHRNRKLLRVALGAAALSLGLDIGALL